MTKTFLPVTSLLVAITILFYTYISRYVAPLASGVPGLGFVTGILASVGFYLTLFSVALWLYKKHLRDHFEQREAITGEWFYTLHIKGKEGTPRYGICKISRHDNELFINGIHYSPLDKRFTARFTSDHVILDGNTLIVIYTSAGMDNEIFMRRGVYVLATESIPPNRIYGIWTDLMPNCNLGDIVMQRRDAETDKLLETVGYPIRSTELQMMLVPANMKKTTP